MFQWSFIFDSVSISMLLAVVSVSIYVQAYAKLYLAGDQSLVKFFSYLFLFSFFMLILITAENFIVLFVGWEGVGICSYLLISF